MKKQNKGGRPAKPTEDLLSFRVNQTFTPAQGDKLRSVTDSLGVSMTDFIRMVVMTEVERINGRK